MRLQVKHHCCLLTVRANACREKEAHNRAVVLEMIGDLPEAESKPPSNMLFICKLNQVTTEEVGADSPASQVLQIGTRQVWPKYACLHYS